MQAKKIIAEQHHCGCPCFIIPVKVLKKFSRDKKLSAKVRKEFADTAKFESEWRKAREVRSIVSLAAQKILPSGLVAAPASPPDTPVFDCQHHNTLPGILVPNPGSSTDLTIKRAFTETNSVAQFYQSVFGNKLH